jgi:hypothetical protein
MSVKTKRYSLAAQTIENRNISVSDANIHRSTIDNEKEEFSSTNR